jgi:ankyrin repeat protein
VRRCVGIETAGAITEILAQRSVPLNLQDDEGRTGLNYFVTRVMLEPAMVLLRHGADSTISRGNDRGTSILKFCFGRLGLREIQRGWGFKLSNRRAFTKKPLELAELIIKGGVDVNEHIGHGGVPFSRPLFWALTETQDVHLVQLLLDAGAHIGSAVVETYDTESESLLRCFFDLFNENSERDLWIWVPFDKDLRKYKKSV